MRLRVLPRMRPDLSGREIASLLQAGASEPSAFEAAWRERLAYREVVWFPYARLGVQCFLETLEARPSRVVTPAFVCTALGDAIVRAGLPALLVDVEPTSQQQVPSEFADALRAPGSVGIAVRTWGGSHNGASAGSSPVLYDLAMAGLDPERVSALKSEDAVVYSLGRGKPISALHGGFLCGDSAAAARRWRAWREGKLRKPRRLRQAGRAVLEALAFEPHAFSVLLALRDARSKLSSRVRAASGTGPEAPADEWESLGPGALAVAQRRLTAIDQLRAERARQIQTYAQGLADVPELRMLRSEPFLSHFPVQLAQQQRDELKRFLLARGVFTSSELYDATLAEHPSLSSSALSSLPTARALCGELLQLPLYPGLALAEQQSVIGSVRAFYRR